MTNAGNRKESRSTTTSDEDDGVDELAEIARLRRERDVARERTVKRNANEGETTRRESKQKDSEQKARLKTYTAPKEVYEGGARGDGSEEEDEDDGELGFASSRKIVDRESEYSKRRFNRTLSPTRKGEVGFVNASEGEGEGEGDEASANARRPAEGLGYARSERDREKDERTTDELECARVGWWGRTLVRRAREGSRARAREG